MSSTFAKHLSEKIVSSFVVSPFSGRNSVWTLGSIVAFGVPAGWFGVWSKLLKRSDPSYNRQMRLAERSRIWVGTFVVPSFCEELLWRVLLLPRPVLVGGGFFGWAPLPEGIYLWGPVSLALYVAAHPLCGLLFRRNHVFRFFSDWRFLLITAYLGIWCTIVYLQTASIWPPVTLHWLTVAVWQQFLGGAQMLAGRSRSSEVEPSGRPPHECLNADTNIRPNTMIEEEGPEGPSLSPSRHD
uniref:CAAX prenyl protease 2/Lysostaphin resistance protein A-like domain-containing protein n=1 Tax=Chromera velia CCMP2878 TaxID=1169474 RepID=A0A0G4GRV6_9ALVE|eukprot:Cvel_23122.t1-p1 / transcript=Cvel_23122.t1 / gene=Cvel_23122 / organism=Chromera_velia_CCMP2878 / gene_product=hypothetical protein / transcript_product=hypothetical protein / location=Cvel_scaffold2348:23583-25079(-) / protein_length=240 / sequence_SO=supercontig / SO=protein_coding / is_pseudo=false